MIKLPQEQVSDLEMIMQRPARSLAFAGSIVLAVWSFPKTLILIIAGYLIYKILYFQRGEIYGLGKSRFFFLGSIALVSFLLPLFFDYSLGEFPKNFKFSLPGYFFNTQYNKDINDWLFANADNFFRWKSGLIFSPLYAVILYFLNVELDNRTIKKIDLTGLQITSEQLNSYNEIYGTVFSTLSILVMTIYSLPLAVVYMVYLALTEGFLSYRAVKIVDVFAFLVAAGIASINFDLNMFLNTVHSYKSYVSQNGIWDLVKAQFGYYEQYLGHSIIIAGALGIKSIFNFTGAEVVAKHQEIKTKEEQLNTQDGVWIGNDTNKKPVIVADRELNQHCLLLGSTGSGKTTTIFSVVDSALERGLPVIFLDGKGSKDLPQKMRTLCKKHGRTFRVFALDLEDIPEINAYNPFASGNFTQWKNRIMNLFAEVTGRGQEHFALAEEAYLNLLCQTLYKTGVEIDLRVLLAFLEHPQELIKLAQEHDEFLAKKIEQAVEENKEMSMDIVRQLELFFYSHYGELFHTEGKPTIKIKEAIKNGECILFMFNASSYAIDTRRVAKMVINDINSSFAELANEQGFTKTYCIFDEFASYASENLAETISLHRSNGMHAVIGTQSITTVSLKSEETRRIAQELIACCNTFIVQAIGHLEDIELLAKTMGTRKTYEVTTQINAQEGGSTGLGSVKHVDEFAVNPQDIRELGTGEGFIYRKAAKIKPYKVKFRLVI